MVPKVKAPWPLLAKSWARALGRVFKTYISNSQEVPIKSKSSISFNYETLLLREGLSYPGAPLVSQG